MVGGALKLPESLDHQWKQTAKKQRYLMVATTKHHGMCWKDGKNGYLSCYFQNSLRDTMQLSITRTR